MATETPVPVGRGLGWHFDMAAAPRWKRLQIACQIRTSATYVHRWTVFCELGSQPCPLDVAWREPANEAEPLAPIPELPEPPPWVVVSTQCEVCNSEKPCTEDEVTGDAICESCFENGAEAAWERQQEEPCFRGNEYERWLADQMAEARKLK